MPTATRIYVGQTSSQGFDGFAGFRIGQTYTLTYSQPAFDQVAIELPHGSPGAGPLLLSSEEFNTWFKAVGH